MRMLMPSHARNVTIYKDAEPLFTKFQIERQLNAMFSPHVPLKSGGYLVINQTEALVAIDVNSGRSTREFSIEETALHTNLEAADEIARQLKLRDLAGLIVIDFIDMEERRNNRAVERRIKDVLRNDRARVQVGRISHFGLLEMSRQRMRTGVLEGSTSQCSHCQGTGIIRSTESVALAVLRALEDAVMSGVRAPLVAQTTASVALYIFNHKREFIEDMQTRHGFPIMVDQSGKMTGATFTIEKGQTPQAEAYRTSKNVVNMDWGFSDGRASGAASELEGEEAPRKRRRRRRGGRRGDRVANGESQFVAGVQGPRDVAGGGEGSEDRRAGSNGGSIHTEVDAETVDLGSTDQDLASDDGEERVASDGTPRRPRRRGRRGGRRNRERRSSVGNFDEVGSESTESSDTTIPGTGPQPSVLMSDSTTSVQGTAAVVLDSGAQSEETPQESKMTSESEQQDQETVISPEAEGGGRVAEPAEPQIERIIVTADRDGEDEPDQALEPMHAESRSDGNQKSVRKGWWQRRSVSGE